MTVFVGEGEDAEWLVSRTRTICGGRGWGEDTEWWVSRTMTAFVGEGMGKALSGELV